MSSLRESLKSEFQKLDKRAKEAETKLKNEAKEYYQKVVDHIKNAKKTDKINEMKNQKNQLLIALETTQKK